MINRLLPVLLIVALVKGDQNIPFKLCGTDHMGVQSLSISEYPVKAGDKPTIKVTFKPDEAIGGGAITVSVKKLFVPLGSLTVDICSQMGLACPLTPGQVYTAGIGEAIPSQAPSTTVSVRVLGKDSQGNDLTCLDAQIQIEKGELRDTVIYRPVPLEAEPAASSTQRKMLRGA